MNEIFFKLVGMFMSPGAGVCRSQSLQLSWMLASCFFSGLGVAWDLGLESRHRVLL